MYPPDKQENSIRFGCGFVFGFFTTAVGGLGFLYFNYRQAFVIALCVGLVMGYFAMRLGDRFWAYIVTRWWWPF